MARAVTLSAIAKRLGVSVQTVSNALNNTGRISEATAEMVRKEADAMGYRPNVGALALRGTKTRTLALILCDSVLTHSPSAYLGFLVPLVASSIRDIGYAPMIQFKETEDIENAILPVRQGLVDGAVMVSSALSAEKIADLARENLPIVLFEREAPEGTLPFVTADYADGIAQAVRHVHAQGARRITYLDGRPHWPMTSSTSRYQGFLRTANALGMEILPDLQGNWQFESGVRAFGELLARGPLPDAIVCANDQMAVGIIRAAQDRGIRVPQDLLVTGFDDLEFALYTTPQLTSVRLPLARMSARAAEVAAALANGPVDQSQLGTTFPTDLIVRASSTPAPRESQPQGSRE